MRLLSSALAFLQRSAFGAVASQNRELHEEAEASRPPLGYGNRGIGQRHLCLDVDQGPFPQANRPRHRPRHRWSRQVVPTTESAADLVELLATYGVLHVGNDHTTTQAPFEVLVPPAVQQRQKIEPM